MGYFGGGGGGGGASTGGNNAWTGTNSFIDNQFSILDNLNNTKIAQFQAFAISPGTTRTYTLQDNDGVVPLLNSGNQVWTSSNFYTAASGIVLSANAGMLVSETNATIEFGSGGGGGRFIFSNIQTPSSLVLSPGTASNVFLVCEYGDTTFNFAHPAQTNPTIFLHSANQSTTEWIGLTHIGTAGVLSTGPASSINIVSGNSTGVGSLAIGGRTTAATTDVHTNATAVGSGANVTGTSGTAFGTNSNAVASGTAMGVGCAAQGVGSIAIGVLAIAPGAGQLVMGRPDAQQVTDSWLGGSGVTSPTPVAYEIRGGGGGGTNIQGSDMFIDGGVSTGNAKPAMAGFKGGALGGASGATAQTLVQRVVAGASKVLTNNTATAIVNCTLASNTAVAGFIDYAVEVFDGTDIQIEEGRISYHAVNKAGAFSNNTTLKSANQQAATAGTLVVTWTITAANPAVVTLNANSSLTPSSGYPRVTYNLQNLTQQVVAAQ